MPSEGPGALRAPMNVLLHSGSLIGLSDAELLERFVARRDPFAAEAAFAALAERHGAMVLRVCRGVLGDPHDAQDARQATFLVLARRARSIRRSDSLASWLHGVALRVAAKAKTSALRRRARERRAWELAGRAPLGGAESPPSAESPWPELHEELARLPEKFRAPIVLCHLEGLTQEQAAGRLRWPVGTLQSRLARGKARLRDRLARRGLAPSSFGAALAPPPAEAAPATPAGWAGATARAAVRITTRGGPTPGEVPATAASLAEGVLKAMLLTKLKAAGTIALAAGLLASLAGDRFRPSPTEAAEPPKSSGATKEIPLREAYSGTFPDVVTFREIALRVVDEATGAPIDDATVRVLEFVSLKYHDFRTDADGRLRVQFPVVDPPALSLEILKDGYVEQRFGFGFEERPKLAETLGVALRGGTAIGGVVVNEAGEPIEGVKVLATARRYSRPRKSLAEGGHESMYDVPALTDSRGRWRNGSVPPDAAEIELKLFHPDYVSGGATFPGVRINELTSLRALADRRVMVKGKRIEGRVTDDEGRPIAGARIVDATQGLTFLENAREAFTGPDGSFHLHIDPADRFTLSVQAEGYAPPRTPAEADATTGPLEFRLGRGTTLLGRVVDTKGRPIPGVMVFVSSISPKYKDVFLRIWTDSDGRFRWEHAPEDTVPLDFNKGGYQWLERQPVSASPRGAIIVLKRASTVVVTARDRATGAKIERFTFTPGIESGDRGEVSWDLREAASVTDGQHRTQLLGEGPPWRIRVESPGYEPYVSGPIHADGREIALVAELSKPEGPGLAGVVRSPDGKPLAGAEVVAGGVKIRDGKAVDPGHAATKTDAEGRFMLPPMREPFPLAVVADGGFARVTREEFAASPEITIRPWGRIEGELRVGTAPAAGRKVELIHDLIRDQGEPTVDIGGETTTDAEGRFAFEKVIPSPDIRIFHDLSEGGDGRARSYGALVDVKPGERAQVTIGGTGRPVIGRILVPGEGDSFRGLVELDSNRPRIPYPKEVLRARDESLSKWGRDWWSSPEGRADRRSRVGRSLRMEGGDGSFRFEDIPAGEYRLTVTAAPSSPDRDSGENRARLSPVFTIPGMPGGRSDEPFDLGPLTPEAEETLKVGDPAPPFDVESLDGGRLRLEDFRGKYVLLDFWATWCGPCIAELPLLKEIHEAYGRKERFAMIGLSLDDEAAKPREFAAKRGIGWKQGFLGGAWEGPVIESYRVRAIPNLVLIGPDGRVVATGLRGEAIRSAVATALDPQEVDE